MNAHEQRVHEYAYQLWQSEGRPIGHEYPEWKMPATLAMVGNNDDLEQVTGDIPSVIAPDEPFNPDPAPEIDPAPAQPEQPTPPAHPNNPPHTNTSARLTLIQNRLA